MVLYRRYTIIAAIEVMASCALAFQFAWWTPTGDAAGPPHQEDLTMWMDFSETVVQSVYTGIVNKADTVTTPGVTSPHAWGWDGDPHRTTLGNGNTVWESDGTANQSMRCNFNYSSAPNPEVFTGNDWAVSLWFKALNTTYGKVIESQPSPYLRIDTLSNGRGWFNGTSVNNAFNSSNVWYHLVLSYDYTANNLDFYVDGSKASSTPTQTSIKKWGFNIMAGASAGVPKGGQCDDVLIYQRALTQDDVDDLKAQKAPDDADRLW